MTELILQKGARIPWRELYALCKPKVVYLIVFTAIVGMLLASPGMVPLDILFFGTLGIGLGAASGAAINHWVDQRIDAIMEAGKARLRPILMTSLTTALGLLPMAMGFGEGSEVRTPMAITVIGGLTVSTLLTLVVIPVVYSLMDRKRWQATA